MNEITSSNRPELFLQHQDGVPIMFYLTSRIPDDWAIWIRSHGGSVATKPTDAQFVIFPKTELLPRETSQLDAFKKRDIPTVRLQWLVRMRRLGCITSWTQWALDPTYQTEPLVEDQELAVQLCMLGVDNIEDESVNLGEVCRGLSRRFPHHPIEWFEAQLRGYRPDVPLTIHQEILESSPATVPSTAPLAKEEQTAWYLPTPTSSQQQSQSHPTEEERLSSGHNRSSRSLEELDQIPWSNISEAANNEPSPIITATQTRRPELGSGEEEQGEEGGDVPCSIESDVISDGPIMGGLSPIPGQPHSPTSLEPLFQGSRLPFDDDYEMGLFNAPESVGVPPMTNDTEEAARLLHGIDDLSHWEPTPSIDSHSRNDRPPPTFDHAFGLWYKSSESGERHEGGENNLYKKVDRVQENRVVEEELEYGWELLQGFIRISTWMRPVQLGRRMNRLFDAHGGKINWVEYLSEEDNYQKVQDMRRKWREVHWRARNPDADEDPPTHRWFTFGEAIDPAMVRASPPEVSDEEVDELLLPRSRPKNRSRRTGTGTRTMAVAGEKRKRATRSCTKTARTRRDGVLASSSPPSPSFSSSSSSNPSRPKEDLTDCESSSQENDTQGRRKRKRFDEPRSSVFSKAARDGERWEEGGAE